jgi:alpha/beta hydrolase fold
VIRVSGGLLLYGERGCPHDDEVARPQGGHKHLADIGVGDCAGGNLAAVVSLLAQDKPVLPGHQLLIYPMTDLVDGQSSASAWENAQAKRNGKYIKSVICDHTQKSNSFIFRHKPASFLLVHL